MISERDIRTRAYKRVKNWNEDDIKKFARDQCKIVIDSVFRLRNKGGVLLDETASDTRPPSLYMVVERQNANQLAYYVMNRRAIHINEDHPLLAQARNEDWAKYTNLCAAIACHEVAHYLYTDMTNVVHHLTKLHDGFWSPRLPDAGTPEREQSIREIGYASKSWKMVGQIKELQNILEDGYIETRFRDEMRSEKYGQWLTYKNLTKIGTPYLEDILADRSPFEAAKLMIWEMATYGTYVVKDIEDVSIAPIVKCLKEARPYVTAYMSESDCATRLSLCYDVFVSIWPLLEKPEEQNDGEDESSDEMPEELKNELQNDNNGLMNHPSQQSPTGQHQKKQRSKSIAINRSQPPAKAPENASPNQDGQTDKDQDGSENQGNDPAGEMDDSGSDAEKPKSAGSSGKEQQSDGTDEDQSEQSSSGSSDPCDTSDEANGGTSSDSSQETSEDTEDEDAGEDEKDSEDDGEESRGSTPDGTECDPDDNNGTDAFALSINGCGSPLEDGQKPMDIGSQVGKIKGRGTVENLNLLKAEIEMELSKMVKEAAVKQQMEFTRNDSFNDSYSEYSRIARERGEISYNGNDIDDFSGLNYSMVRNQKLTQDARLLYDLQFTPYKRMVKAVANSMLHVVKSRNSDIDMSGYYYGKKISPSAAAIQGKGIFKRPVKQEYSPDCAIGILVDCSGSMCGRKIESAKIAAETLYEACRVVEYPVMVVGHNARNDSPNVTLQICAGYDSQDENDRFRIMELCSDGCNHDGAALCFMYKVMMKLPNKNKLLIVISDGAPNGYQFGGEQAEKYLTDLTFIAKRKYGIKTIAAAIDDDKEEIKRIYGSNYLDITDLGTLPRKLLEILKRTLV